RVTDYTHARYIPITDGTALVWEHRNYFRHSSNLTEFSIMIDETAKLSALFPQSHMRKLLDVDTDHIRNILSVLKVHHRIARSLDFLGTALKVVAGTPDAADLEMLNMSESRLIESNNRQVVINTETQKQINKLTDAVNEIIKAKKNNLVDTPHLYEVLLARNRMLITEIQNLMLTVTLAKSNIINPAIFNHEDLKSVLVDHPTEVPVISLIEASNIKVLQSDNIIHVLIAYPKIKFNCKKVTVFPVSHQHTVLQLRDNVVAECNQGVLAITDCVSTMYGAFCKLATQDTCARGLHAGVTAHCETQASHLSPITLVDDGIMIVNECPAVVSTDDGPNIETNGTHLIIFERLAFINGTKYLNLRESIRKTAGVAASPLLNIIGHNHALSMPMLQRMNSQNLETIQTLKNEIKSAGSTDIWIAVGVGVSFLISTFILLHLVWRRRRDAWEMQQVAETFKTTEDGLTPKGGVVKTSEGGHLGPAALPPIRANRYYSSSTLLVPPHHRRIWSSLTIEKRSTR
ncbi:uncharacterized protein Dana_GF27280, partial [Drosophila ananassae]